MLNRISKLLRVLSSQGGWQALLKDKPRSLASFLIVNQLRNENVEFKTIIDAGANVGQFARASARAFPQATIHSFEPLASTADQFEKNLGDVPNCELHRVALGSEPGEITFHQNSDTQTSSALALANSNGFHDRVETIASVKVPVTTLDDFFRRIPIEAPVLIKLDLQGFELEALKGATNHALPQAEYILLETVFEEVYKDEPLFDEIYVFLQKIGFSFVRPLAFVTNSGNQIVQMDALFQKRIPAKNNSEPRVN